MVLEMGEAKVRELICSPEALAETVREAISVLRQAALHELLSSIVLTEGGARELKGVPWTEEKEALTTPPIPVQQEVCVTVSLRQAAPLWTPLLWVQRDDAGFVHAGTLSAGGGVDMTLTCGQPVRLCVTLQGDAAADAGAAPPSLGRAVAMEEGVPMESAEVSATSWADASDDDDFDELPSIAALEQSAQARRAAPKPEEAAAAAAAAAAEAVYYSESTPASSPFFEWDAMLRRPAGEVVALAVQLLQEERPHNIEIAVEALGVPAALSLLHRTLSAQADGGMRTEDGRARSAGGVFLKLLRESDDILESTRTSVLRAITRRNEQLRKEEAAKRKAERAAGTTPFRGAIHKGSTAGASNSPRTGPDALRKHKASSSSSSPPVLDVPLDELIKGGGGRRRA